MKYSKPEIEIKDLILPKIASNDGSWLDDTDFEGAEDSLTDFFMNFSW